jgi:hypothetical protein
MKYIITQLVNQKQELEEKLAKTATTTPIIKPLAKPVSTKPPTLSSSTLKKPSPANPKSNVKYAHLPHQKKL